MILFLVRSIHIFLSVFFYHGVYGFESLPRTWPGWKHRSVIRVPYKFVSGTYSTNDMLTSTYIGKKDWKFMMRRSIKKLSQNELFAVALRDEDDGNEDNEVSPASSPSPENVVDNAVDDDDDDDDDDNDTPTISTKLPSHSSPLWEIGNNFDHFLNQCTIQSFLYLLKTCHDPQTVMWLENFTQPSIDPIRTASSTTLSDTGKATTSNSKLLSYHGLGAMNSTAFPTWDAYFHQLLQQPKVLYSIESYHSFIPTYEMEINPSSLCTRLISVREQIAREFSHDLRVLYTMKVRQLLTNYENYTNQTSSLKHRNLHGGPSRVSLAKDESLFLDSWDASDGDYVMPSPLRKGNFDLLLLLTTQESIHRILNDNGVSEDYTENDIGTLSKTDRHYLSTFYLSRVVSHFTGRQPYGRANQFLQELVMQSSRGIDDGQVRPLNIVEHILSTRQQVAREWSHHAAKVSDLHIDIKRLQFSMLMQSYDTTASVLDSTNSMQ